jgi:histidine triad (HIT) family protein
LIIPKRKIERMAAITDGDVGIVADLLLTAANFAKKSGISSYRLVVNSGALAGETVPHLHIHLLAGREMGWPPG